MNARIFSSRSTRIASVGVCTRPTVVRWKPPALELNAVIARVPLMPTSQSASERHFAASASGSMSLSARSGSKPSRIAPWRHRLQPQALDRLLGLARAARCSGRSARPRGPASQALTRPVDVLALDQAAAARSAAASVFSIGSRSKCGGITGRCANDHLPRLTSYSSGSASSSRWPTADDSDVLVAFEVVAVAREAAERARDVGGDGRLLGDDEFFSHAARKAADDKCKRAPRSTRDWRNYARRGRARSAASWAAGPAG